MVEDIESILVLENHVEIENADRVIEYTDTNTIRDISKYILDARATGKYTLNDFPLVSDYIAIYVSTKERTYRYFIYKENCNLYLEQAYHGVYKINSRILNFL